MTNKKQEKAFPLKKGRTKKLDGSSIVSGPLTKEGATFFASVRRGYAASACLTPSKNRVRVGLISPGGETNLALSAEQALKFGQQIIDLAKTMLPQGNTLNSSYNETKGQPQKSAALEWINSIDPGFLGNP